MTFILEVITVTVPDPSMLDCIYAFRSSR